MLLLGLVAGTTVFAQGVSVTLKVDVVSETDTTTKGGSTGTPLQTVQQNKSLQITLANAGQRELPDLNVVYYIFAKDIRTKDVVLAKKGQQTATVKSLGKVTLNTESAMLSSHSSQTKKTEGHFQTTLAGGTKYYGYGVQVLSGERVLAERFDPLELKASIGLSEAAPPSTKAKKKSD